MASYKVEVSKSAEKTLFGLPKAVIPKIIAAMESLTNDPFPVGCRRLSGEHSTFRIRVQVYRIIYEVHKNIILVRVLKIGHRKDVYRNL